MMALLCDTTNVHCNSRLIQIVSSRLRDRMIFLSYAGRQSDSYSTYIGACCYARVVLLYMLLIMRFYRAINDTDFGISRNARLFLFIFGAIGRIYCNTVYKTCKYKNSSYNVLMNTAICDERFFTQQEYIHIYDV